MADINSQILEALNQGVGPQDIIDHLSTSDNPENRAWVANYRTNLISQDKGGFTPVATIPTGPDVSGVQALGGVANKAAGWYAGLSTPEQIALPVAGVLGTYAAGKAVNLGFNTLQDKLKAAQEIKTQAALNALPPSAAVQVQQGDLALRQAAQAQQFAQQGAGAPPIDYLTEARVATETQRAATESARTETAKVQAALAQEKLIQQQRKAAIVATTPAAKVTAAEALPVEAQPVAPAQSPAFEQLKQEVAAKQGAAPIEGAAAVPTGEMAPVNPAQATPAAPVELPSASPVATPESVIVNDTTGASPVDKANAIVQTPETPAVEISKVAPVAATPVEGAAVPRTTKNVLAFPNVPAPVIPPGTPANARRTAEQIAVLKAEDPLNKGYNQVSRAAGITAETPAPEARSFMDRVTNEVFGGKPPASQGGAAPQAKQITNFIETNQKDFPNIYSKLKEIQAKYPTQSGSAHLGMLAGIAGLGLGALGAYGAYKEGKQTGDWTNLGLLGGSLLAMSAPAQAAYQAATYSKSLGETPEELKAFGQMLKNSQQAFKVGAGRGVAPPSSYNR